MRVLIAGGRGFLGTALAQQLRAGGHEALVLTRQEVARSNYIHWDGATDGQWSRVLEEVDAVVNATGYGLEHWPWSRAQKHRFSESRILPGRALTTAILQARRRPPVFVQFSGINHYGLTGDSVADESTPPGTDFLAQLTVQWEGATSVLEQAGVRWIAVRNAIVLDAHGGLLPLMLLPLRLYVGGRLGSGTQPLPWIHTGDQAAAVRFLLENGEARGVYNLVAPAPTSNDEFMRAAAKVLHRPYWVSVPGFILRSVLGEMSQLVLEGRYCTPQRLLALGFRFTHSQAEMALRNLLGKKGP